MHALLVSMLLASSPPAASPPVDSGRAVKLFESGRADYRAGRFQRAIDEFLAADALRPSPTLDYNVAAAYEKLGDQAKAVQYYERYLALSPHAADRAAVEATIRNLKAGQARAEAAAPIVVLAAPAAAEPAPAPVVVAPGPAPLGAPSAVATTPAPIEAISEPALPPEGHPHAVAYALGAMAGLAAVGAVVGAVEVASFQGTRGAILGGTYNGSFSQAQGQQGTAAFWGPTAIVLAVVAAAGMTGAVLSW